MGMSPGDRRAGVNFFCMSLVLRKLDGKGGKAIFSRTIVDIIPHLSELNRSARSMGGWAWLGTLRDYG
jgi:hypothetical protein